MSSQPHSEPGEVVSATPGSLTTMTEYVLPTHANVLGNVFGGQIMAWLDLCAAICAQRHTHHTCVTVGIDDLSFERPIRVGQVVRLVARVTATFRSSLEIHVDATGEDAKSGQTWPCVSAYVTFVAIDADGRPVPVPPLERDSAQGQRELRNAEERRARRLARRRRSHAQTRAG